ncbi:Uncharacterized protein APZ42_021713 [Daphnia magna]|uniref:Uncharacterized protein n=1 Tax=Daphnia magna TaxID=35525 RepID=A0A164WGF1_9CRUS|nr:Uncharacterized protein APZ42_021713 [Daphnia magna]
MRHKLRGLIKSRKTKNMAAGLMVAFQPFTCKLLGRTEAKRNDKTTTWRRPRVEVGLALLELFRVMDAEDFAVDLEKHSRTLF